MGYRYVVCGAGKMGTAAAYDLLRHGDASELLLLDHRYDAAVAGADRLRDLLGNVPVRALGADVSHPGALREVLQGANAVLSCLPYWLNLPLAQAALAAGAHFNDLGGNTEVVRAQLSLDEAAKERGLSIIPDCGLAPGLVNQLAAAGVQALERCDSVRIRCGGLPQEPKGCLNYAIVFSVSGLTNEYTGKALCLRDGQLVELEALSEEEELHFEGFPPLEAFVTTGGTSLAPETFRGAVQNYDYKTIRYRGHGHLVRCFDELGLLSLDTLEVLGQPVTPRRVFEALLEQRLTDPNLRDLVLVRVQCEGIGPDGKPATLTFELVDRHDEATGFSSMARCTSFPAATVTALQAKGLVSPGARNPARAMEPGVYLAELARRDLPLRRIARGL